MVLWCQYGHDSQCCWILSVSGLGSELFSWLFSQLVTRWIAWFTFLSLYAFSKRATVTILFASIAQLHAHVTSDYWRQSFVLAHFAKLFPHFAQLLPNFAVVQSNLAIVLADFPQLFSNQSPIFTNFAVVQSDITII